MPAKPDKEDYFVTLAKSASLPDSPSIITKSINENGHWENSEEWRIFTETNYKITKIKKEKKFWFRVEVRCDHEFSCHCPTVERAIEMAGLYQEIIRESFYQIGWPSWEAKPKTHNKRVERTRKKRRAAHAQR